MSEQVLNINPNIDLKQCILWQYQNSPALKSLILAKEKWYQTHQAQFWQDWYDNIFNLDTANDFGLVVWGQILNFPRTIKAKDGSLHLLTTEQYRMILKGQLLKFGMGATAPEINEWLAVVFNGLSGAFCIDTYDMTAIPFVLLQEPTPEIGWLLANIEFFPRPAGVGYQIRIIPDNIFGFYGSGLRPFNQGVFNSDYSDILTPADPDTYQVAINAPAGATVTIDGDIGNWKLLDVGTTFNWTVSKPGYISASGTETVSGDMNIDISTLMINNTTGVGTVYVNNQQAIGAFFRTGNPFDFSYSVGLAGYIPLNGSGTVANNRTINVSRLLINTVPSNATVTLNGQSANGAFFVEGSVFEYTYSATLEGFVPATGTGYVTQNGTITATLGSGSFSVGNIKTDNGASIVNLGSYTAPANGKISLTMAASKGFGYGALAKVTNLIANQGDIFSFVKINGNHFSSGSGVGMSINGVLKLVVGGGAGNIRGGAGFIGGYHIGTSIDGSTGNSLSKNLQAGDGGINQGGFLQTQFGGSGYNQLPSSSTVSYERNYGVGYVNLTFEPN
ncbi:MAG: DUF2612 domain-containing protein [Elusimicrobiaceae bacterium]|nr:DUF2612 domain-containing protein [Elusimicrobiaceae bacterium]MBR4355115.1 DUF2612 domain-containing protein [Elusimicrobiaceae bacterium]